MNLRSMHMLNFKLYTLMKKKLERSLVHLLYVCLSEGRVPGLRQRVVNASIRPDTRAYALIH